MSGLRKTIAVIGLCIAGSSAQTLPSDPQDQLQHFAGCAGRLSAQMEFQWMFDGAAADQTKNQRAQLLDFVEALMTPEQGRQVLNWRVEAKMAHAALLTRATFNDDPRDAKFAVRVAQRMVADCTGFLLG